MTHASYIGTATVLPRRTPEPPRQLFSVPNGPTGWLFVWLLRRTINRKGWRVVCRGRGRRWWVRLHDAYHRARMERQLARADAWLATPEGAAWLAAEMETPAGRWIRSDQSKRWVARDKLYGVPSPLARCYVSRRPQSIPLKYAARIGIYFTWKGPRRDY